MAYLEPRGSLTSADVHFLSTQPSEMRETVSGSPRDCTLEHARPADALTSDVSDIECDEDEEDSSEWLALELVQHLPQEKMSKLLGTMQRREKLLQDARRERKVLLESCKRLKEENEVLTKRLLQDKCADPQTLVPLAASSASSKGRGSSYLASDSQASFVRRTEPLPVRVSPVLPGRTPACPETTGHKQAGSLEAALEDEEEAQPAEEVMLKVHSGSAVRRVHISRFELSDVQAALRRLTAGKPPAKAVIIVGNATSSRFEVQALSERSWQLALTAARDAAELDPSAAPMVRMRLDGRGDVSAR